MIQGSKTGQIDKIMRQWHAVELDCGALLMDFVEFPLVCWILKIISPECSLFC